MGDRVVIEPSEGEDVTRGGILLPETAKEQPQQGTIVAVGAGRRAENGKLLTADDLMVGKFLAGLLATCVIFVTSEVLQIVVFTWQFTPNVRDLYLYQNHGLTQAAAYLGVTALACLGYGAFFLAAGMLFRNPILPAAAILVWEGINPFLPALLKKFSVIYYLKSLCPVDIPSPPGTPPLLSLLVSNPDPISAPVAIMGLLFVSLLVLYVSSFQIRRMEINYTTE